MSKQFAQVSDFVDFKLENSIVMVDKCFNETVFINVVYRTESFCQQSKKVLIDSLHHAALDDHIDQLMFVPLGNVHFEQFMCTLFEINCRLDDEVNGSSQVDQILFCQVMNLLLLLLLIHLLLLLQHLLFVVVHLL